MAGRGLDAGLTATVQDLWEQARPVALEREGFRTQPAETAR